MAKYELLISATAERQLKKIPTNDLRRLVPAISALAEDPYPIGCRKLQGQEAFRIRSGRYRVIYEIDGNQLIVLILKVGQRKNIYK